MQKDETLGLRIKAISYYLPETRESNEELVSSGRVPYTAIDIERKTGIAERRVSSREETPVWMAEHACEKLLCKGYLNAVDWLIFCTHTPDYMLPSCSCILHGRLGMPNRVAAFDIALSCTGYVYSLVLCDALLKAKPSGTILLVNADNYTKYLAPQDANVCTIFGDAAAATLLEYDESPDTGIIGHQLCTSGGGYNGLIRRGGGACSPQIPGDARYIGDERADPFIRMDGPEIFRFVQKTVPSHILSLLENTRIKKDEVDFFFMHQASEYILRSLSQRIGVKLDKVPIRMKHTGNAVSASIPLLIHTMGMEGLRLQDRLLLLCGFGAGLSYGSVLFKTNDQPIEYL